MHPGRHTGRVFVPGQQVERRWFVSEQPVVHHVLEDQVVWPQRTEGPRHSRRVQETLLPHLLLKSRDRCLIGERAEQAWFGEIGMGIEECRGLDGFVTSCRVVGQPQCGERSTQAHRHRVHRGGAGDVTNDSHGVQRSLEQVVAESELAHRLIRIAVTDRKTRMSVLDGPLDKTLSRCQIHDVKLVDPRRAEQQRNRVRIRSLRRVLDQLDEVAAVDDASRRGSHVDADLESGAVDLRRPSTVVAKIVHPVLEAVADALAAGVERLADRRGVAGQSVRRGECIDEKLGGETRLCFSRSTHSGGVEEFGDKLAEQQILLSQQEVRRILLIGRIGEPLVATCDRDGTGIVTADRAFGGSSKRPRRTPDQTCVGSDDSGRILQRHAGGGQQLPEQGGRIGHGGDILSDPDQVVNWT